MPLSRTQAHVGTLTSVYDQNIRNKNSDNFIYKTDVQISSQVKRYSLTIIFPITGKSMEISKDWSLDKTLLYLLKLTLTLWQTYGNFQRLVWIKRYLIYYI